jgi:hypothetical protein
MHFCPAQILLFYFSHGVRLSPLGTAATVWPIVPAPDDDYDDDDDCEESVECELAGEAEVLGENPLNCHFVHHKYHIT